MNIAYEELYVCLQNARLSRRIKSNEDDALRYINRHEAEGTGVEPATGYPAPDFESGR